MATSGSANYNRAAKQLIKSALRGIGVLQSGEAPTALEMQDALEAFELMIKSLQANGFHLWTYAEATLFLTASTTSYSFPCGRAVSSFVETITTADASDTDTTITVSSITGIDDLDVIGIVTSTSTIHWTTVSGAPSGSTITLTDALTTDVSSGATVYAYTAADDLICRPLRIESVRRSNVTGTNPIDTPMGEMAREDYFNLPNKNNTGVPVQFYYDPGLSSGTMYVWPAPSVITNLLKFTYIRAIEDFDTTTTTPDFPQEWLEVLKYQLMLRLAHEYGVALRPDIASMAAALLENARSWDVEPVSVMFQPDLRYS